MNSFYGYGNLEGRYWFIGMEEGCGGNWQADVLPRFTTWHALGRKETEDLRGFHFSIGVRKHWERVNNKAVSVQFTWRRLIETILSAQNGSEVPIEPHDIVTYQSQHLGTQDGDSCLLELLPLPSPNIAGFAYKNLANEQYPFFATRALYRKHIMTTRIDHIRTLMENSGTGHVVLYGTTYMPEWNALVMNAQWEQMNEFIKRCPVFGRYVWCVPHPRAWGNPRDLFQTLGYMIRETDAGNQAH
ncbi:hypothetical protein [Massilia niabensis]|uniref:DUF72 domain-containing protein n=1 Tax=Massilia niabensis TaxID=544910 RepID=A0ABW0L3D3_9BURK